MQVLQIILLVLGTISYIVTSYFAVSAYFHLLRIKKTSEKMLMVTMADHIQSNLHAVNEMQKELHNLIQHEEYEQAEKLKSVIQKAQDSAMKSLEKFQEVFGEDFCKIVVTTVKKPEEE